MTKRTGAIVADGDRATLQFERRLPHPIGAVWRALTDPAERAQWLGATTIDPREGGSIETLADGPPAPASSRRMFGKILVWDPPKVLEHEWEQSIVGKTLVRYELREEAGETILTLKHSRLRPRDASGFLPGTHAYLDRLEAQLAGAAIPDWQKRYGEVQGSYAGAAPRSDG